MQIHHLGLHNESINPVFTVASIFTSMLGDQNAVLRITSSNLPAVNANPPLILSKNRLSTPINSCTCLCHCSILEDDLLKDEEIKKRTSDDLSWWRLYMSKTKLKYSLSTSELLAGFTYSALVQVQINRPTNVPEWLFVLYSGCTMLVVGLHIFAVMISTHILPNIDAVGKPHVRGVLNKSPHDTLKGFIELAWTFSTKLGLILFLADFVIISLFKFWDYSFTAAWVSLVIVVPVLLVFIAVAVYFYRNIVVYKAKSSVSNLQQMKKLKLKRDTASTLRSSKTS